MKETQRYFSLYGNISSGVGILEGLVCAEAHATFLDLLENLVKVSILKHEGAVCKSNPDRVVFRTSEKMVSVEHSHVRSSRCVRLEIQHFPSFDNQCGKLHDFICIFISLMKCSAAGSPHRSSSIEDFICIEGNALSEIINRGISLVGKLPKETKEEIDSLLPTSYESGTCKIKTLIAAMLIVCNVTSRDIFLQAVHSNDIGEAVMIIDSN